MNATVTCSAEITMDCTFESDGTVDINGVRDAIATHLERELKWNINPVQDVHVSNVKVFLHE